MKKQILLFTLPIIAILAGIFFFSPWRISQHLTSKNATAYQKELTSIDSKRKQLNQQKASHQEVKTFFISTIKNKIFPYWYGTRWSYSGTTETPGKGSVACGYFVTTVLRDAGFTLNRTKLAQMPSEEMIRSLVDEKYIQSWSNISIETFVSKIKKSGKGVYIIGLDTHTGFVLYDEKGVQFIHASGSYPFCVVNEKALSSRVLKKSKYRVVGKISADELAMKEYRQG
jgi:hypothetical protein